MRETPFEQFEKVLVEVISVVELLLTPELMILVRLMMIPEPPPHPCELFVKTKMKKLWLVQTATTDLGLPVKVLLFLDDLD